MSLSLNKKDYFYTLPGSLIADRPAQKRGQSKLLIASRAKGVLAHASIRSLLDWIDDKDLVVFNDTRVLAASITAYKVTGGRVSLLITERGEAGRFNAMVQASKPLKPKVILNIAPQVHIQYLGGQGPFQFQLLGLNSDLDLLMDRYGRMPLPPYMKRAGDQLDQMAYQTVFSKHPGAIAAPTAGLHFDEDLLAQIAAKASIAYLTLHVGAGTFLPVKTENILDHRMHSESVSLSQEAIDAIASCRARGGRVIAIGTTVVRALESGYNKNKLCRPCSYETDIFIYPGYQFNVVDAMLTNFHLPESTLLMLVSAFMSREQIMSIYQVAIEAEYRFFSYGDAMLLMS